MNSMQLELDRSSTAPGSGSQVWQAAGATLLVAGVNWVKLQCIALADANRLCAQPAPLLFGRAPSCDVALREARLMPGPEADRV